MTDLVWVVAGAVGLFVLLFFVFPSGTGASAGGAALFLALALSSRITAAAWRGTVVVQTVERSSRAAALAYPDLKNVA